MSRGSLPPILLQHHSPSKAAVPGDVHCSHDRLKGGPSSESGTLPALELPNRGRMYRASQLVLPSKYHGSEQCPTEEAALRGHCPLP